MRERRVQNARRFRLVNRPALKAITAIWNVFFLLCFFSFPQNNDTDKQHYNARDEQDKKDMSGYF